LRYRMFDFVKKNAEGIKALRRIKSEGGWLSSFVEMIFYSVNLGRLPMDPEYLLSVLGNEVYEFHGKLEQAREMLRDHPELLNAEIRAAAGAVAH
jgi:hypothetical protein